MEYFEYNKKEIKKPFYKDRICLGLCGLYLILFSIIGILFYELSQIQFQEIYNTLGEVSLIASSFNNIIHETDSSIERFTAIMNRLNQTVIKYENVINNVCDYYPQFCN